MAHYHLFACHFCRILTLECFAVLDELIRHGAISHLFTNDEQTTIANSVRSEVTAAGLTYSRDAAWNFFQSTVMKNLRIVLVCSETGNVIFSSKIFGTPCFSSLIGNSIFLYQYSQTAFPLFLYSFTAL